MNSQDFQSTDFIRHTNIDLSIETTKPSEGGIDGVGSVGSCDNDDVASAFKTVHEGKELRHHSSFDLSMNFLSVWSD